MILDEQQIKEFNENGFLLLKNFADSKLCDEILEKAKESGKITYGELATELDDTNPEEIDKVFDAFEDLGVDLHDDFNSNFVGEPSGAVSDISSLKVSDPTVIKVESEKITNFYNGKEEIQIGLK